MSERHVNLIRLCLPLLADPGPETSRLRLGQHAELEHAHLRYLRDTVVAEYQRLSRANVGGEQVIISAEPWPRSLR